MIRIIRTALFILKQSVLPCPAPFAELVVTAAINVLTRSGQ